MPAVSNPIIRRRVTFLAVAACLLAGASTSVAQADVGWHEPGYANCHTSGHVTTALYFDKLGLGSQWIAHRVLYWDIARSRYTTSTTWTTHSYGYGRIGTSPTTFVHRSVPQGHYRIYTQYAWSFNQGASWSYAGDWVGSYNTYDAGYFSAQESFCRAFPELQIVR
jgi:hypothetical protein